MLEFNLTSVIQLLNFVILLFFLNKFLFKPFLSTLDQRKKKIEEDIRKAEKIREEAEEYKQEMEAELKNARKRAEEIIQNAERRAEEFLNSEKEKAKQEAQKIIENAKIEVENFKKTAIDELKNSAVRLAFLMATKILEKEIDEKKHREYLVKMLNKFGGEQ
ncbi:MAG: F-type H+-transporting ATPase subunit b [Thermotogaceae bacterium]|jgi:F-type H+-transporting ATPase subunit b|nr:F-type H+-transporting ATPase subunit b [Thermotogaceae bacterium]MDN5338711.1 F-type H+-transporting ATPase subunit b [Thermotogaceae bacterium]